MTNDKLETIDLKDLEKANGGEMVPPQQPPQNPQPQNPLGPRPPQRPCHVCGLG